MNYYVYSGETRSGEILENDLMYVSSGGTALDTTINTSGYLEVDSGGTAINTIINDRISGGLFVTPGGVANGVAVNSGGYMRIQPDGKAKNVVENGGYVYVDEELEKGTPNVTFKKNSFSGVVLSGYDSEKKRKATVHSGTTANDTTVDSGGALEILGGIANGNTVKSGGEMIVFNGKANNTVIYSGGYLDISSGGIVNSVTINDGDTGGLFVFDGGVANDVTANYGGYVKVTNGGKAKNVVENGGYVYLVDELESGHPNVTFKKNTFSGVVLTGAKVEKWATVHSGTTAIDTTAQSGGKLSVRGGIANGNTVNSDGEMFVHSGTANSTVVNSGGYLQISSRGTANSTVVNSGGYLQISSGCTATDIIENGGYVFIDGEADYVEHPNVTFLPNSFAGLKLDGTSASIHSGTTADDTTVGADGLLCVYSGGFANDVTVDPTGKLWIYSGGLANGISVGAGGELRVGYGGWITGRMTFKNGAVVTPATEAILDFDLRQTAPGGTALVNDLSFIPNTFLFTITVNGAQPDGTYKLAGGAAAFDQPVYVINTSGRTLGTLTVGGSFSTGMADYTLKKNGSELTVDVVAKVTENGPPEPYNDELVNKKTKSDNKMVTESYGTHLSAPGDDIFLDKIGAVDETVRGVTYCNRVQKQVNKVGDMIDYAKIVIDHGAKLSFHAEASAAATFTVYSLRKDRKGRYSLKKLHTLKLTDKDKDGKFTADSKKLLQLQESGEYYVSMQYTDKRKNVTDAYYNVWLNGEGSNLPSEFEPYTPGCNDDDWTGRKTNDLTGLFTDLGTVDAARLKADNTIIKGEWIGFGDKVDCRKFTLANAAELSFTVSAPDGPLKFSVCRLKTSGTGDKTTYSLAGVKTITVKAGQPGNLNLLRLEAGDYYFKVESANIKKSTGYDVQITHSDFYTDGDDGWNSYIYDRKKTPDEKKENTAVTKSAGTTITGSTEIFFDKAGDVKTGPYHNFVGFGDETDYTKVVLEKDAVLTFRINKTEGAAKFTVNQLLDNMKFVTKQATAIKTAETEKETRALRLSAGTYYLGMQATKPGKDVSVYYDVRLLDVIFDAPAKAGLSMPEPEVCTASADDLAFPSGLAETSLAGTVSGLTVLQDAGPEWESMLA